MRTTFSKLILLCILFSQVAAFAQDGSIGLSGNSVTVDFRQTALIYEPLVGRSSVVKVDPEHQLLIFCKVAGGAGAPCTKNADGSLIMESHTVESPDIDISSIQFQPLAKSISGVFTVETNSIYLDSVSILLLAVRTIQENFSIALSSNIPLAYNYPFSYVVPDGDEISRIQILPKSADRLGLFGIPNGFYKVSLQSLTWTTGGIEELDLSVLPNFSITSSTVTTNDKLAVRPNEELTFSYDLLAVGRKVNESRQASVSLFIDNKLISTQIVSLSSFNSDGKLKVNFKSTLSLDDIGRRSIRLTIDQDEDTNMANNYSSNHDFFYVSCNVEKVVEFFAQVDPLWASLPYAGSKTRTMFNSACYTSSFAMLMKYYGINKSYTGQDINPLTVDYGLLNFITQKKIKYKTPYLGYVPGKGLYGAGATDYARVSYITECIKGGKSESECQTVANSKISWKGLINFDQTSSNVAGFRILNENLCKNNPIILSVPSTGAVNNAQAHHFVIATGMTIDLSTGAPVYKINDPGLTEGKDNQLDPSRIRGLRLYKPMADPSMVFIAVNENLDMLITEPDGKKVGKNSLQNIVFNENGNAVYSTPEVTLTYGEVIEADLTSSYDNIDAKAGEYTIEVFNHKSVPTSYTLIRNSFDINGNVNEMSEYLGTIQPGSSVLHKAMHSTEVYSEENASMQIYQAKYFDTARNDKAFVTGRITPSNQSKIVIANDVQITIGNQVKTIPIRKFQRQYFNKHHVVYTYANWGRKEVVFQINTKTGNFLLYFDNIDLDDSKPSLNVDLKIMLDNLVARSKVTFKNIVKRKHGK